MVVELVLHEPRLHPRPQLLLVDLEDIVHEAREIHDDGAIDGLAGQGGAAPAGEHGDVPAVGDLEHGLHVARVAWDDDADRLHLVHRGVGGIEQPRVLIEADVADFNLYRLLRLHRGVTG